VEEGVVDGSLHASYLHVHWAGHPGLAARFVAAAARYAGAPDPVRPSIGSVARRTPG
jgi:cobyrinic acid a,c-diamide synthase